MTKTAFVTGGTGFVGINLIELLVREDWKVTALHRATSDLTYLNRFPVELAEGSVTDRDSLERAVPEGTEVVFHVAGDTSFWSRNDARQSAINIDGTRNMVEIAASKGVGTFIHTSSRAAWGRVTGEIDEETPRQGGRSWINYEKSKYLGERAALEGVDLGMKVVVVNPADIVGPYDLNTYGRIFFLLRDGKLPVVASGSVSVAHVHDVVRAHLDAAERGRNGESYILGGEACDVIDFVGEIARISGAKAPMTLPAWVMKLFGQLSDVVSRFTNNEPDVTPELATLATTQGLTFRSDKAIRELGYRIQPRAVGIRDAYDWLVAEGLLEQSSRS